MIRIVLSQTFCAQIIKAEKKKHFNIKHIYKLKTYKKITTNEFTKTSTKLEIKTENIK